MERSYSCVWNRLKCRWIRGQAIGGIPVSIGAILPVQPPSTPVTPPASAADLQPQPKARLAVIIDERTVIPDWVIDHASYRRWAHSDEFPKRGRFSFIDGTIWVALEMEEFFGHNQVKQAFNLTLGSLAREAKTGYYVPDGVLWTNPGAGISTEADAMFFTYDALRLGRIRMIEGAQHGYMEVEGTPDMTFDALSDSSVKKDTVVLKNACAKAGVAEYWLVDARGAEAVFQIWLLRDGAYALTDNVEGWQASGVFSKSFKLEQSQDPLGHPSYQLLAR